MPNPEQRALQQRIADTRRSLQALENQIGELRATFARGGLDAAQAHREETRLLGLREGLRATAHSDREALLKLCRLRGDAIGADALDARMPLALLPVRLETRYRDAELLVRIYPDEIHIDAHDAAVSDVEREAWSRFRKAIEATRDLPPMRDAWRQLARDVGVARAAYLATHPRLDGVPSRPPGYARPPRAGLLPERFVVHVWLDDPQQTPLRAEGRQVREPLALAPDPTSPGAAGEGSLDDGCRWMTEFAAAEAAGMALRVSLPDSRAQVARLVVLGVRSSADPTTTADDWEAHLRGQHAAGGLSLPPPGSATNALPGERPLFSARPDPDALYTRELDFAERSGSADPRPRRIPHYLQERYDSASRRWEITDYDRGAPAVRVAEALGLSPQIFGWLDGAVDPTLKAEPLMLELLRGAFEPGLREAFGGEIPLPIAMGFDLLANRSALGPYPTVMVRSQPYGVLPLALERAGASGDPDWDKLWAGATALRSLFVSASEQTPRIGGTTPFDPVARMIELLQTEGIAIAADIRLLLSDALAVHTYATATGTLGAQLQQRREQAHALYESLGGDRTAAPPLTERILLAETGPALPLVMPADPGPAERPEYYLSLLAENLSPSELLTTTLSDFTPRATLFHVARIALLEAAADDTRRIMLNEGVATEADFAAPNGRYARLLDRLLSPAPAALVAPGQRATLGDLLADRRNPIGLIHQRYDVLRRLAALEPAQLEWLFGAGLGLYANRLDALYTARAAQRLSQLRSDNLLGAGPDGFVRGVHLGAFGWVGAIPRAGTGRNAGYVLAPSAQHAVAAGVLLSADHARRIDRSGSLRVDDYAVELSSRRTRDAVAVLDGLREGQAMPALLGYRIERTLTQAGGTAPALIARLRGIASTAARPIGAGGMPLPDDAAEAVCDGLSLVRRATAELTVAPDLARLGPTLQQPRPLDTAQTRTLLAALEAARDAIDATADVLLAESVFQLSNGNPSRAGGATDILSGAVPPPDRLDVLHPPERGIALNHRLLLAFDPQRPLREGWMSGSPRGLADPDLESWMSHLLPLPAAILIRLLDRDGTPNGKVFTLQELLAHMPADEPPLGPLDLVHAGAEPERIARGPLEARLRVACAALTGDDNARFDGERDPSWGPETSSLQEAVSIAASARAVLGHGRALQTDDVPGTATVDETDLEIRRAAVLDAALTARERFDDARSDPAARPIARRWADAFGLPSTADDAAGWTQAARELGNRIDVAEGSDPLRERIAALFDSQPVLPRLNGADGDWLKRFHAGLAGGSELRAFAARAGRVRPAIAAMNTLETLSMRREDPAGLHSLAASQTPYAPGDTWVGARGVPPRGRTSFVAWRLRKSGALENTSDPLCGLLLDRWSEVVPSAETDAAVAFHVDAPTTAAPNAILLCVPEPGLEAWTEGDVLAHMLEALELAKLRTVQPQALGGVAQFAPLALVDNRRHQFSFGYLVSEAPPQ
jgi:hypothetical protein